MLGNIIFFEIFDINKLYCNNKIIFRFRFKVNFF